MSQKPVPMPDENELNYRHIAALEKEVKDLRAQIAEKDKALQGQADTICKQHDLIAARDARIAEIKKWFEYVPNPAETLGTFQECRCCGACRSRQYGEEWKEEIKHRDTCILSSSGSEFVEKLKVVREAMDEGLKSLISLWRSDYETPQNKFPENNDPSVKKMQEALQILDEITGGKA